MCVVVVVVVVCVGGACMCMCGGSGSVGGVGGGVLSKHKNKFLKIVNKSIQYLYMYCNNNNKIIY